MFAKEGAVLTRQQKQDRRLGIGLCLIPVIVAIVAFLMTHHGGVWPSDTPPNPLGQVDPPYHLHLALRVAALTLAGFVPLWLIGLQDRKAWQSLAAVVVIATAGVFGGYLSLLGEAFPSRHQLEMANFAIHDHREKNQDILARYVAGLRDLQPEQELAGYRVELNGLWPAREAVRKSAGLVETSRKAYAATLPTARAELKRWTLPADIAQDASGALDGNHAALARYWDLQGRYVPILQEMLSILERRHWQIRDRAYVFDNPADREAWRQVMLRRAALSAAVDKEIAVLAPDIDRTPTVKF